MSKICIAKDCNNKLPKQKMSFCSVECERFSNRSYSNETRVEYNKRKKSVETNCTNNIKTKRETKKYGRTYYNK